MAEIIVIAHNIRSTYNVGSLFRTADGFGVTRLILTGYTPYPSHPGDARLPHIAEKITHQIHKTALDAETIVPFAYEEVPPIQQLKEAGYRIVALEQAPASISLPLYKKPEKLALVLGEEVHGIPEDLLAHCDDIVEIPMVGEKESFNVSVAAAIALYQLSLL